ncbi:ribosome maturation factor RimM [Calothrix sp. 336/3]|uniref:ribosome maturation factor RimM n=2 Tax=Calothrix sp. 336/3 TaxID=1337936 RepID=UPI0009E2A787
MMNPPQTSMENTQLSGWIEIGKIVAPQGLQGEIRVYPETDFPERFEEPGTRWLLYPGTTEPQAVELISGRYLDGKNLYVIQLAGIESRSQVDELRGCKLLVAESDRPELAEGEYHILDLIDLPVYLQASGELVGKVVDVLSAGNDLLEVEFDAEFLQQQPSKNHKKQTKVLIPFVMAIAPVVDLVAKRIEITPPPGLLEINNS